MPEFVHLHCHSEYSLLDGANRMSELTGRAAKLGMPAVALTDHGNMFGAIEFYKAGREEGVKPILGMEAYVATGSMSHRSGGGGSDNYTHFTLLASSNEGYANLVKLSTAGHLEGFYYKPRVDQDRIATHAGGLIALSGCLRGDLCTKILAGDLAGAREAAGRWREIFGKERYFIELHDHGLDAQRRCNPELIRIARDLGLGLAAANDVHFLEREHHESHDVLLCIGTGSMVLDSKRMRYSDQLYFKTAEEMAVLFGEVPEALSNTVAIAERCEVTLEFGKPRYPAFDPPAGQTREGYLRALCEEGLVRRYGDRAATDPALRTRLEYELGVLEQTGFVSYFLIVWDFIHFARTQGIPVGPGRGSAAGSLVAYVLGITDLDPIRFDLLFERFLNPDRVSPPDIDVDFCMVRRNEVIEYVRRKYGERCVSQIVTFGTLGAKSVVRDVGRVLGWSYSEADRLAKMIPADLNMTLAKAAEMNSELDGLLKTDEPTQQLWKHAVRLEGLSRNSGIHAAGVVIGDRPLDEYIPLCRGKENEVVTQYEMKALTSLGMLKMDFLGLKTLTVLDAAVKLVRRREPGFDLGAIPLDDSQTFAVYNRGETVGVFQMEGGGLTAVCKRFDVRNLDDIVALGALYRPGPMQFIDDYIARKKGRKPIAYEHPLLEQVCADTYGILVYQEQVQKAANVLAGYTLAQADLLRRAMGKKDAQEMAKEKARFIEGCAEKHGISPKVAGAIFGFIESFAQYGFNKSHSAAYGLISYQTAFLKARYTVEFMAALLTHDAPGTERLADLVSECQRLEIPILPPDINESRTEFVPVEREAGRAIRFGLASIKNVGAAAVHALVGEREAHGAFTGLDEFCRRLDSRSVNRKVIESLVKCGAFDAFAGSPGGRAALFAGIERAMAAAAGVQRDRSSGQGGLFDAIESDGGAENRPLPEVPPWPLNETLAHEKELLGFYVTGHPLEDFAGHFDSGRILPIAEALRGKEATVKLGGIVVAADKRYTKKDKRPFGVVVIEDFTGSLEITAWDEVFVKHAAELTPGAVVCATVKLQRRDEAVRASASAFATLKPKAATRPVRLRLDRAGLTEDRLGAILAAAEASPGKRPLILEITLPDGNVARLASKLCVADERPLAEAAGLIPNGAVTHGMG
jgi:DNA polymerase-3 subunit alpha